MEGRYRDREGREGEGGEMIFAYRVVYLTAALDKQNNPLLSFSLTGLFQIPNPQEISGAMHAYLWPHIQPTQLCMDVY